MNVQFSVSESVGITPAHHGVVTKISRAANPELFNALDALVAVGKVSLSPEGSLTWLSQEVEMDPLNAFWQQWASCEEYSK
jgi:hypothetical protein